MPERPLPPGSTIGILGGGQLGRMLAMAAARLGLKTHIYSDEADAPAFDVARREDGRQLRRRGRARALRRRRRRGDLRVRERAGRDARSRVARGAGFPRAKSFAVAQDRLAEKDFVTGLGIPVAPYARVDTAGGSARAPCRAVKLAGAAEDAALRL